MLGQESSAEVRHSRGLNATRHDAVDGDVLLNLKNGSYGLDPLMDCSLCTAVLWECRTRINANHAASDDDLTALAAGVVAHEVRRQSGAIDGTLEVDVGRAGIWLRRQVINGGITARKVVLGVSVYAASVGNEDIETAPFLPDSLEEVALRLVRGDIALYKKCRVSRGIER